MGERRIVGRRWRDFKWTKGKMGETWFELRVGSFVMPRTRAALLHSARAGRGRR